MSQTDYLTCASNNGYGLANAAGNALNYLVNDVPSVAASAYAEKPQPERKISRETILSGQFMISELEDDDKEPSSEVVVAEKESFEQPKSLSPAQEAEIAVEETSESTQKYVYGPTCSRMVTIDGSLSKLFQCMSLAYNGTPLTSPKWKTFKGLRLKLKDKIRLNNIIWRAWHIQCKCSVTFTLQGN